MFLEELKLLGEKLAETRGVKRAQHVLPGRWPPGAVLVLAHASCLARKSACQLVNVVTARVVPGIARSVARPTCVTGGGREALARPALDSGPGTR